MKRILFGSAMLLMTTALFAQQPRAQKEGPHKPPPVEERWKHDGENLKALSLSAQQTAQAKNVFMDFYKNMDALLEKCKDKRPQREDVDKLISQRNEALKKMLNKDQVEKFKSIERNLMPPPPGGKKGNQPPPNV